MYTHHLSVYRQESKGLLIQFISNVLYCIGMNATTTILLMHQEPRKEYQAQYHYLCAV